MQPSRRRLPPRDESAAIADDASAAWKPGKAARPTPFHVRRRKRKRVAAKRTSNTLCRRRWSPERTKSQPAGEGGIVSLAMLCRHGFFFNCCFLDHKTTAVRREVRAAKEKETRTAMPGRLELLSAR